MLPGMSCTVRGGVRRSLATRPSGRVAFACRPSSTAWWAQFKKELKEQFTTFPEPKGYVNTSYVDTELWERMPKGPFRYALKQALLASYNDWRFAFSPAYRAELWAEEKVRQAREAGVSEEESAATPPPGAASPRLPTAEETRAAVLHATSRIAGASQDGDLKATAAAAGTAALRVARDSLDAFLTGYAEGKTAEVRTYIDEAGSGKGADEELQARLKRIREKVVVELATQAKTAAAGTGPVVESPPPPENDARLQAAAASALSSLVNEPGVQALSKLVGSAVAQPSPAGAVPEASPKKAA
jgi:hypothetical protein